MKTALHGIAAAVGMAFSVAAMSAPIGWAVRGDADDILYKIDLATGVATAVGAGVGFGDVEALTFSNTGVLYGVDDATDQLITIDTATGVGTAVGALGVAIVDMGLSFDAAGNLYMSTDIPANFYSINVATGAATLIGAQGQLVTGLAYGGGVMYGLGGDGSNNLVTIDLGTGAATNVGALGTVSVSDGGIDFDGATLWGIEDGGDIFTIDTATGAATVVAGTLTGFEGLAIQAAVPEPGTLALLGLGLVGIAGLRRRALD